MKIKVGERATFHCAACLEKHTVPLNSAQHFRGWSFNGSLESPTLKPSVRIRSGCKAEGYKPGEHCWCIYNQEAIAKGEQPAPFKCGVCHFHVTDGNIEYCGDSTHAFAGKSMPLEDFE